MQKEIVVIRLNKVIHEWCIQEAEKQKMNKSEFLRKIITDHAEEKVQLLAKD